MYYVWCIDQMLYRAWGSFGSWYRPQPLGLIRDYYGDKVAMYFAWLGTEHSLKNVRKVKMRPF